MKVVGSGKINIDLLFSGLDRLPNLGEELYTDKFKLCLGGGNVGTLINLSRLGVNVSLQTAYGDDLFSNFALDELRKSGVQFKNGHTGTDFPLNVTAACITGDDRTFLTYGTLNKFDDKAKQQLYGMCLDADIVLMELGYLTVYKELKKLGKTLILDLGWWEDLSFENYGEYLTLADYYIPNQKEALLVSGCDDYTTASDVLAKYYANVIIKLDSQGCYYRNGFKCGVVPTIPEFAAIDSTGAGDAFLAGFVYGLTKGYTVDKCVLCGNLTGGKCVTAIGCLTEYYNEDGLEAKLKEYSYLLA